MCRDRRTRAAPVTPSPQHIEHLFDMRAATARRLGGGLSALTLLAAEDAPALRLQRPAPHAEDLAADHRGGEALTADRALAAHADRCAVVVGVGGVEDLDVEVAA